MVKKSRNTDSFCPFRKEFQMECIEQRLTKDFKGKTGLTVLEACSGQGRLLYYLNRFDNRQNYFGFDYVREFVKDSNALFKKDKNIHCEYGDIYALPKHYRKKFDITILYKTLSYCLPNPEKALRALFSITKKKIYITAPLYEGDIDFEVKIRAHKTHTRKDEYLMYYIYSMPRLKALCRKLGARKVTFHDMRLPFPLPKPRDPDVLRTYTIPAKDGTYLEFSGIVLLRWKLVEIKL